MTLKTLRGSGGGGKAGQPRQPKIAQDSAASTSTIRILYGLSEGEVKGLANGLQAIKLDGTPLVDSEGNPNFQGVQVDFRTGTIDQDYIKGFSQVENETEINVKVTENTPLIRAFSNTQLSAVRVRLRWDALRIQQLNGDITGANVSYGIELKTDGGAYVPVLGINFNEKTSAGYERSHRINLPAANDGWQIRVTRTNPDSTSELVSDEMFVASITEIIDAKLRYPHTALLGIQFNAETFDRVPKIAVQLQGLICSVPTNYNASAKTYDGVWDGTFKQAYTTNPAWQFYTLALSERFGAGAQLTNDMLSKWSLYAVGQYCDQLVSDGDGGLEPRYTSNVYLQSSKQAYAVLADFVGVMISLIHWDGSQLIVTPDAPSDTRYTFTRANVIDGVFEYSSSPVRERHTIIRVAWDNPDNEFKTEYEYVSDPIGLQKYGVREREVQAFGCTSKSQAQRRGQHALKTEQFETRQVQFAVGLEGYIPEVGSVIEIADEMLAGRANSGRITYVSTDFTRIKFDRSLALSVGDRVAVNTATGEYEQRTITEVLDADAVIVDQAFSEFKAGAVYAIDTDAVSTILYRVLSITETSPNQFAISAVQYEPLKFDAVDSGADIRPAPITLPATAPIPPPATLTLSSREFVEQGLRVTDLVAEWSAVETALAYQCEVQRDFGIWQKLPKTSTLSAELPSAYAGDYTARVQSIDQQGRLSAYTYSNLTAISSRNEPLETVTLLDTRSLLFGIEVFWEFDASAGDADHVEIQQADSDTGANTQLVGRYAYPTDSAQQTGLQGGLVRFYRARVVDKLGNVSVWTDWAAGISDASADKVLDLLAGEISFSELTDSVNNKFNEIDTNKTAINARVDGVIADVDTNQASINSRVDGVVSDVNDVAAGVDNNTATIQAESTARADADSALSTQIDTVSANTDDNTSAIQTEQTARTDADSALSSRIDTVVATSGENTAAIQNESTARTDADSALSSRIDTVVATADGNTAAISDETTARADADGALSTRIDSVAAIADDNTALITDEQTARADADSALAQDISTVSAATDDNTAAIQSEQTARADADSAIASDVTALTTTVDGNSATITQQSESIDGIEARHSVAINNNGRVTGYQLISGEGGVSSFDILADSFTITSPDESATTAPFVYQASPTTVDGVTIPAGLYVTDAYIKNLSVGTIKIASGAVTTSAVVTQPLTTKKTLATVRSNNPTTFTEIVKSTVATDELGSVEIGFGCFKITHQNLVEFPADNFESLSQQFLYSHSVLFRVLRRKSGASDVEIYSGFLISNAYSFNGVNSDYEVVLPTHEYNFQIPNVTDYPGGGSTTYIVQMVNLVPPDEPGQTYYDYGAIEVFGSSLSVRVIKR